MSNIKQLLPRVERYFKTNLHTHCTISDGRMPIEEVKERYKANGYQVLCMTDHNVIADHSDLNEPDFLMLTGIEVNFNAPNYGELYSKTYHLNLIAKDPTNKWSPREFSIVRRPTAEPYEALMQREDMGITCHPESINTMIAKANEKGFLVMYNHPTWSCHEYPDYAPLKGLWGMELRNTECCMIGHNENNFQVFKDLLNCGNRLFPVGTDDAHFPRAVGGSWIMVGAEALRYSSVINALEEGDFYMSCGPEITDLFVEDGVLKITCSDAQRINLESNGRYARVVFAKDQPLREAQFPLDSFFAKANSAPGSCIHLTVTAADGSYAATRAYFLDELV